MYLSKLVLNDRDRTVQRDLSNAHKLHQRIMQAFPDEERCDNPRRDWHILFRQEPGSDIVLVQSAIAPDWSKLPDHYLRNHAVKEMPLTAEQLSAHRLFQFRLRANPSKRDRKTRKTIGFYRRPDQLAWLERQGERSGFRLINAALPPMCLVVKRNAKKGIRKIQMRLQNQKKPRLRSASPPPCFRGYWK